MIFKDLEQLQEAYQQIQECACNCTNCESGGTCDCEEETPNNQVKESKKEKPDYLDADEDGNKKESMKKALKDKVKESLFSFKALYLSVMSENK